MTEGQSETEATEPRIRVGFNLPRDEIQRRAARPNWRAGARQASLVELLAGDPDIDFEPELLGGSGSWSKGPSRE